MKVSKKQGDVYEAVAVTFRLAVAGVLIVTTVASVCIGVIAGTIASVTDNK